MPAVSEPDRYRPVAPRWLGRLISESRGAVALEQAEPLARVLKVLPCEPAIAAELVPLCTAHRCSPGVAAVRACAGGWGC